MPWYKRVRRYGQTNLTEIDPAVTDMDFWKRYWKETRVQGVIINAGGVVAYYPSKFPLQYRAKFLGEGDLFGLMNTAAREAGLAVLARMDINRAAKDFFDAHPDWFCRDINGEPIRAPQGETERYISCVNSGYYKVYIPELLRELIERYHPDGFADNSWSGLGGDTVCYCENCKAAYKKAMGLELPLKPDSSWIRWSRQTRLDNWKLFNRVTAGYGGGDCLWLGMVNANPISAGAMNYDLHDICREAKIVMIDHQSRDAVNGFEENGINGMLIHDVCGWDKVLPESIANYVRGPRTFRKASAPPVEARTWLIEGIAGGISPWYHHIGAAHEDRRQFDNLPALMQWHEKNERYLYNRALLADAAVVWNSGSDYVPFRGVNKALIRARVLFKIHHGSQIPARTEDVKLLIFPDIAELSETETEAAHQFVRAGGSLVLTGKSVKPFEALTGITLLGETGGAAGVQPEAWDNFETHTYMRFAGSAGTGSPTGGQSSARHPVFDAFENTAILPFGGQYEAVASNGKLDVLGTLIPAFPVYPPEFSWMNPPDSNIPLLFAGQTGYGGRVVYFAGDFDRCYGKNLLPDHGALIGGAVKWALDGRQTVNVEGPGYLDCKVYTQEGDASGAGLILHIVNLSGLNHYPGYEEEYHPVRGVKISVKDLCAAAARLLVAEKDIETQRTEDGFTFLLEEVIDHEVVYLPLAN